LRKPFLEKTRTRSDLDNWIASFDTMEKLQKPFFIDSTKFRP
jgi:hypothetical protein